MTHRPIFGPYSGGARKCVEIALVDNGLYGGGIRGVRASASLKPRRVGGLEGRGNQYPRRSRLGLIEAAKYA